MQGITPQDVGINGYPLFHVAGVLPGSLAALSAGVETIIPTTGLFRNREVIANYWRLVERYRCTYLSAVPTVLAAPGQCAAGRRRYLHPALLPHGCGHPGARAGGAV